MVRVRTGAGKARFESKESLLAGGASVRALRYQRASADRKKQAKSVLDQGTLNVRDIVRHGWSEAGSFTDNDLSASRHARKERPDFERLMEVIAAGQGDVLVVWEISRKERDLAVYVQIRDLCSRVGLFYWLVGGVLFDLRDKNDRMMLGFQAVQAEWLADSIRDNVLRGMAASAEVGRPHGKIPYGYRRRYDERTRAFLAQVADEELREAVGEDGTVTQFSPAGVVREIFESVAGGVPLITIERSLNARGIPSPTGERWGRLGIRRQALNPAYIGKRVFRGEVVGEGLWDGLVDEETFWACVRLLQDPSRTTTRAGRAVHLLSYIVKCGVCGGPLSYNKPNPQGSRQPLYSCLNKRCTWVNSVFLDEFVERVVVAWLSRPDVFEVLTADAGGDEDVATARAEAQRLRAELEEWRKLSEQGEVQPISFARAEKGLLKLIAEHEQRASEAGVPPVLRGRIGPEALRAWAELGDEVAVKREIIRTVADIRVLRPVEGDSRPVSARRLDWRWKFGPEYDDSLAAASRA